MATPRLTASGIVAPQLAELGRLGSDDAARSRTAPQVVEGDEVADREVELLQVGADQSSSVPAVALLEHRVPRRAVLRELHHSSRADREDDGAAVPSIAPRRAALRPRRRSGCRGCGRGAARGRAGCRRPRSGSRRGAGGPRPSPAGRRSRRRGTRSSRCMFGEALRIPRARPGLSAFRPNAHVARRRACARTPARRLRVPQKPVEDLRVEEERATPELVLDEEVGQGLDLGELGHALLEVEAQGLGAPAGGQGQSLQRHEVVAERGLVPGKRERDVLCRARRAAARSGVPFRRRRRSPRREGRDARRGSSSAEPSLSSVPARKASVSTARLRSRRRSRAGAALRAGSASRSAARREAHAE